MAAVGCFVAPFTFEPEAFGVLLGIGEAGTFRGAGPIVDEYRVGTTGRIGGGRGGGQVVAEALIGVFGALLVGFAS